MEISNNQRSDLLRIHGKLRNVINYIDDCRDNPIASQLRRLGKQVVPDKRRDKEDKRLKKEAKDAKTQQDT